LRVLEYNKYKKVDSHILMEIDFLGLNLHSVLIVEDERNL